MPSDCAGEPCVVPVSCVTTAELSPPGFSMSATNQGLVQERLVSLTVPAHVAGFSMVVSLELSSVFSHLSLIFLELSRYVGLPGRQPRRWDQLIACAGCWEKR